MNAQDLMVAYAKGRRDFCDADLWRANLCSMNLRGVNLYRADLRGADLSGADLSGANLRTTDLGGANLGGANLIGADLSGADLSGANLCGTTLRGADLSGANLGDQWVIQGATRSDGYAFLLTSFYGEGLRVKAGCRNFTPKQAWEHWSTTRNGTELGDETMAIIDNMFAIARIRGYVKGD